MSFGGLLAIVVLLIVIVALVFSAAAPAWLPLVLTGMLSIAILLTGYPISFRAP